MFHIIDDQAFVREIIAEMLEGLGYASLSFASPLAYLEYVKSLNFKPPIVTFTDINMPEMLGYDMIDEAFKISEDLRFIVVTSDIEVQRDYLDKVSGYLAKPFRVRDLIEVIGPFLRTNQVMMSPYGKKVTQQQLLRA